MAGSTPVSPFAPTSPPDMPHVRGVALAAAEAGIKYQGRKDLLLVRLDEGTIAAGVTTQSKTCSAPVLWCRKQLAHGRARSLVVNAGNANAFTGQRGQEASARTARAAADALGCDVTDVYLASTGVIGEPLDASSFPPLLTGLARDLKPDPLANSRANAWADAAAAIMTTDTFAKLAGTTVSLDGHDVAVAGIAKGSGMIAPDMATMLAFVFTDAAIAQPLLQDVIQGITQRTFNCVTVDSDTSTSDTFLVFATGASGMATITSADDPRLAAFSTALETVARDLAIQIVKDGEGISKFVTVSVSGAEDDRAAKRIALSIANSPLVKTAIAGSDANWGRVVMAVGKAGEAADRDKLAIRFGPHTVAEDGARAANYAEADVSAYMAGDNIDVHVDVGIGDGTARVWTCDLTHGYISINADYRS
ncbi:MAG: bifunctional glutamate N-acetyltransferase/amino-acid acetyltransferase ArgJ [Pseudomonadota bacterium]